MKGEEHSRSPFSRRQWRRRLSTWKPVLIGLLVVGVFGLAGWALFLSSWLAVDDVDVAGARTLSTEEIVVAAGVEVGTPLARVDLDAVTDQVEELPAVAEASVHRSWPDTVSISVTERTAIAALRQRGEWWVMDGEGVVFRRTADRAPSLPVVQTASGTSVVELKEVATVVTALPDDVLAETGRVQARTVDSITLWLRGGRQVVWGSAAESERKLQVLQVLLERQATVYDVSVPEQPTTTR